MKRIYCLIGLLVLIPMELISCSENEVLTEVNAQSEPALQVNTEEKALETHAKLIAGFKQAAAVVQSLSIPITMADVSLTTKNNWLCWLRTKAGKRR